MDNKYKTKLCRYYDKYGKCNNSDKCNYAHGEDELRCFFDENCINKKCKRLHVKREMDKPKINLDEFPVLSNNDNVKNNDIKENRVSYSNIFNGEKISQNKLDNINDNDDNKKDVPISFNIDGVDISKFDINELNINSKKNNIDIIKLINDIQNIFEQYSKDIKQAINNEINNNHIKSILLRNLNEIKMEIDLFISNYKNITNM